MKKLKKIDAAPLTVVIAGASGMVGSALTTFLTAIGHRVLPMSRNPCSESAIKWDPIAGKIEANKLEKADVVINLSGENIGSQKWNKAKREKLYNSRILSTRLLVNTLNSLKTPPKVFISASAIGYYGTNANEPCAEEGALGSGFLASLCCDWEAEANRFKRGRCVTARIGVVLSPSGGILPKMLPFFNCRFGAVIGSGKQWMSWIALEDLISIFYSFINDNSFAGPVNVCAPNPVTNSEFTKTLARVLSRPAFLRIPAFLIKAVLGQMGKETLLASTKVLPKTLQDRGYVFCYPRIKEALSYAKGK